MFRNWCSCETMDKEHVLTFFKSVLNCLYRLWQRVDYNLVVFDFDSMEKRLTVILLMTALFIAVNASIVFNSDAGGMPSIERMNTTQHAFCAMHWEFKPYLFWNPDFHPYENDLGNVYEGKTWSGYRQQACDFIAQNYPADAPEWYDHTINFVALEAMEFNRGIHRTQAMLFISLFVTFMVYVSLMMISREGDLQRWYKVAVYPHYFAIAWFFVSIQNLAAQTQQYATAFYDPSAAMTSKLWNTCWFNFTVSLSSAFSIFAAIYSNFHTINTTGSNKSENFAQGEHELDHDRRIKPYVLEP